MVQQYLRSLYLAAMERCIWGWRDQAKKEKGLIEINNSVVIAGRESMRGINGNGKNTIKINFLKSY